ncbi:MAG: phage tail family protein [Bacillota bacterium]|nr:phage tail family protein [Bacillota bacterium]
MYSFNFLGKDSYEDFGIVVEKRPIIPKPARNVQYFEVEGRSGSLRVDDETYKDIIIPLSCGFKDDDVATKADMIKSWLDSGEGKLIFSNQVDRYYIAHVVEQIDITQEWKVFGQFSINFRCKPFKYAVNNDLVTMTAPGTIINQGTQASLPVIKIYGTGTINLYINSETIRLSNIADYIVIDSVLMDAYRDTQLMNANMLGDFPKLETGVNDLSWDGTVTKVEITPNWMWL